MGDWFQTIVDKDATATEASDFGKRVISRLAERGIISLTMTDSVLGSEFGYPPGPNYEIASIEPDDVFLRLWTNGLQLDTGHHVSTSGQGGFELVCAQCSTRIDHKESDRWTDAIQEWFDGSGAGIFKCLVCRYAQAISEWQFDPPWGFSELSFTFWNWPQLKDSFVKEIGALLGHRIVLVRGKL